MMDNIQFFNLIGIAIILIWLASFRLAYNLPRSKPNNIPDNKSRLRRAVITGYVLSTFILSIFIFIFIFDQETSFLFTGLGVGIIVALPVQILATLGSYHQHFSTEMTFEWFGEFVEKIKKFKV